MGIFSFLKKDKPKEKKGGWVYVAESTRSDGSKKVYTGMTRRSPKKRWGEHIKETKKPNSKTWTGKGKSFKPLGAIWSSNPEKAEQTLKKKSSLKKRSFGKYAASKYKKRKKYSGW